MRHFLLSGAIGKSASSMVAATIERTLIAPGGGALFSATGLRGASSLAVDVTAIAAGADQHLYAAARAEIEARRLFGLSTDA